jgi:hypothetical protein
MKKLRGRTLVLVAYLALCLSHSAALPLFESTDEGAHFVQVNFIASTGRLPDLNRERPSHESAQPPLYHLLAALAVAPIDRSNFDHVLQPNPDFDDPLLNRNNSRTTVRNQYLHGPAEVFPYQRAALAAHVARGVSMLLGALTLLCAHAIARLLFEHFNSRGWTALAPARAALLAMALIAFNPRFVHVTSLINNDNGALLFGVAGAAWLLHTWTHARPRDAFVLGALIGAALLAKLSALAICAPAALWVLRQAGGLQPRRIAPYALSLITGALLTSGWWFARNIALYGDPLGWEEVRQVNTWMLRATPLDWVDMLLALPAITISFWHAAGGIALPIWTSLPFLVVMFTPLAGLGARAVARIRSRRLSVQQLAASPLSALAIWCMAMIALYLPWLREYMSTENGRFVLGSVTVLAPLIVLGWDRIAAAMRVNRQARAVAGLGVAAAAFAATWAYPAIAITPWFAAPEYLDDEETRQIAATHPVSLARGVTLRASQVQAGADEVRVRVVWGATEPITQSYRVAVSALDANGVLIAERLAIPHDGRFATTRWQPGRLFADEFALPLPPGTAPTQVQLSLLARNASGGSAGAGLRLPINH